MPVEVHVELSPLPFRHDTAAELKRVADDVVKHAMAGLGRPQESCLARWHVTGGQASQLYASGDGDGVIYKVETYPNPGYAVLHVSISGVAREDDARSLPEERELGREDHQHLRKLCGELTGLLCKEIRKRHAAPRVEVEFVDRYAEWTGVKGRVRGLGERVKRSLIDVIGVTAGVTAMVAAALWGIGYLQNGTVLPSADMVLASVPATIGAAVVAIWEIFQHYVRGQRNEVRYEA